MHGTCQLNHLASACRSTTKSRTPVIGVVSLNKSRLLTTRLTLRNQGFKVSLGPAQPDAHSNASVNVQGRSVYVTNLNLGRT